MGSISLIKSDALSGLGLIGSAQRADGGCGLEGLCKEQTSVLLIPISGLGGCSESHTDPSHLINGLLQCILRGLPLRPLRNYTSSSTDSIGHAMVYSYGTSCFWMQFNVLVTTY